MTVDEGAIRQAERPATATRAGAPVAADDRAAPAVAVRPLSVDPATPPSGGGRVWPWVLVALILIGAGIYAWMRWHGGGNGEAATQPAAGGGRGGAGGPVPVVAVAAHRGDLPVYLNALGTVTPLNVVTIRSRVDGELVSINFKEGQIVHQGDVLAQIDPRAFEAQVAQAQGQLAKDQAALENAKADLAKYESAGQAVTKQQVDTQQTIVRQNEGAIEVDRGALAAAQLQLTYSKITAPLTGRIGLRMVDQGNIVHASDATGLATIAQVEPISVVFTIPQDQIPQVVRAQRAEAEGLVAEAWDRDFTSRLSAGRVAAIDNQVDPTTGTVRLKATFDNADGSLFPSQFVNVRLLVDTIRGATLAPAAAVQHGPDNDYVYIVGDDQTVSVRPVKRGPGEGEMVVIAEGVQPGETLVTAGVDKLRPGAKVNPRQPGNTGGGHGASGGDATSRPAGPAGGGGHRGGGNGDGGTHAAATGATR